MFVVQVGGLASRGSESLCWVGGRVMVILFYFSVIGGVGSLDGVIV